MPTYVLSKLKRSIEGQKIGDLVDLEAPTALLTAIADADKLVIVDDSDSDTAKVITGSALKTWLASNVTPAWANVTGKPGTFPPSTHTHAACGCRTSGVFDPARIPAVPAILTVDDPDDRQHSVGDTVNVTLGEASGGTSPYTYSIVGTLPAGLSFAAGTRVLSGTPTAAGTHDLTYRVTDSGTGDNAQTTEHDFEIVIIPAGSRYILTSGNTSITANKVMNGEEHGILEQSLTLPTWTGNRYIVIAQPADQPDLTRISLAGLGNSISDFTKSAATVSIDSIDYEYWVSNDQQGDAISGEIIEVLP